MAVDFTPTLVGYTEQKELKFWCQQALPLVYDDSLSYYELLNKVVAYINNLIDEVNRLTEEVEALQGDENDG